MSVEFFVKHAGFSYDPKTETPDEGKRRCAAELATAEEWARDNGITFVWQDDWSIGSHEAEYGEAYSDGEPETCETCIAYDGDTILASLGCIDGATPEYRRVIEAELASEARAYRRTILPTALATIARADIAFHA